MRTAIVDVGTSGLDRHVEEDVEAVALGGVSLGRDSADDCPEPLGVAFNLGDVVYGTVSQANFQVARADIMYHEGLQGFMPADQSPLTPEEWASQPSRMRGRSQPGQHQHGVRMSGKGTSLVRGHTRPFKVTSVPPDMALGGRGPLLSAYKYDCDMLWARVSQLFDLGMQDEECVTFSVRVHGTNNGGLLASVMGLEAFVPKTHIVRREGMNVHEAAESLVGTDIEVAMLELEPFNNIRLSETRAASLRLSSVCHPGCVVWGTVRHVASYGVTVELDGLDADATLGIRAISGGWVASVGDVFSVGERIAAVVTECGDGTIRLSTQLLETASGEMLTDKGRVFARTSDGPGVYALPGASASAEGAGQRGQRRTGGGSGGGNDGSGGGGARTSGGGGAYGGSERGQRASSRGEVRGGGGGARGAAWELHGESQGRGGRDAGDGEEGGRGGGKGRSSGQRGSNSGSGRGGGGGSGASRRY